MVLCLLEKGSLLVDNPTELRVPGYCPLPGLVCSTFLFFCGNQHQDLIRVALCRSGTGRWGLGSTGKTRKSNWVCRAGSRSQYYLDLDLRATYIFFLSFKESLLRFPICKARAVGSISALCSHSCVFFNLSPRHHPPSQSWEHRMEGICVRIGGLT